jgi:hypothetical protein
MRIRALGQHEFTIQRLPARKSYLNIVFVADSNTFGFFS